MAQFHQVRIRGENRHVPAARIGGNVVICLGRWPRLAKLADEELVEGKPVRDIEAFCIAVRESGLGADLVTVSSFQCAVDLECDAVAERDSLAVIRTDSFDAWWTRELSQDGRKSVRRAEKRGVHVKEAVLDSSLVLGIKQIYDETPVRQGRKFWHYGKSAADVRAENATYPERSWFLGAYVGSDLIGFLKVIEANEFAYLIQILSKQADQDRRPTNALLAEAVRQCEARGLKYLVYGNYRYGSKGDDSLSEFKRRNGFKELAYLRYFIPLNYLGRSAVAVGLHRGWDTLVPRPVAVAARNVRARFVQLRPRSRNRKSSGDGLKID